MRNKYIFLFMVLCILLSMCGCSEDTTNTSHKSEQDFMANSLIDSQEATSISSVNEVSIWDGTIANAFSSGTGTSEDPYIISSGSELAYVGKLCSQGHNFSGEYLELSCNINLNGLEWTPIGTYSPRKSYAAIPTNTPDFKDFQGEFDGKGYTISNYKINAYLTDENEDLLDIGLFGSVRTATIKNIVVKNFDIQVHGNCGTVGGLVGESVDTCLFKNCHAINGNIYTSVTGGCIITGGLIGSVSSESTENEYFVATYITDCSASSNIHIGCNYNKLTYYYDADGEKQYMDFVEYRVGGLIGDHYAMRSSIVNCYSAGSIYVNNKCSDEERDCLSAGSGIGGLVAASMSSSIENSYSTVDIEVEDDEGVNFLGGLAGFVTNARVQNCYYYGNAGFNSTRYIVPCGGLIGQCEGDVINCFVSGNLSWSNTNKNNGFLIGDFIPHAKYEIENCYVSENCKIKDVYANNTFKQYDVSYYAVVSEDTLKNKEFIGNTLKFEEYTKKDTLDFEYYSGWIITGTEFPKMYYAVDSDIKEDDLQIDVLLLLEKKANYAIDRLGTDYVTSGYSLSFPNIGITLVLDKLNQPIIGTERITNVIVSCECDVGNQLSSKQTFDELKRLYPDICEPTYLEIDGTFSLVLTIGKYNYNFVWTSENYHTNNCDYVSISK